MSYEKHKQAVAANPEQAARELSLIRDALDRSAIVAITDQAGRIIHVNDKFCEISGYPREELLGQNHRIVNSGYHEPEFFVAMWKTISSGQVWEGEIRNRAKNGGYYWVHTTIVPFRNEEGKPYQYVSIRYEITQRKMAEEQLRITAEHLEVNNRELQEFATVAKEREENFRLLLDSIFEGIVLHETDGHIVAANLAAAGIFGGNREDLLGKNITALCGEGCSIELLNADSGADDGTPHPATGRRFDGREVPLEISSKPFVYLGRPLRLTAIHDVSRRKELEAQVLMQDRLASVGLLASSLAHEIGNPLGIIRGRAEYLTMQEGADEKLLKTADVIIKQIDRLSNLVRSLLNLSRGEMARDAGQVHLNTIFSEVVELMRGEVKKAGIQLHVDVPAGMTLPARAEAGPLHQVLLNLLVNSIHAVQTARKQGRAGGEIFLGVSDLGKQWEIYVRDTGCGISRKNRENLFKPFFTTKEVGVGTGLGLATSFRIVEGWGGSIQVESEEGVGSTFRVLLPKA